MFNCTPKEVGKSCEKGTGILALISGFPFQISVLEIFLQSYETNFRTESSRLLSNANLPHLVLNNFTQPCSQALPTLFTGPTHFVHRPHPPLFTAPPTFVHRPHPAFQHVCKHLNEASMHVCPLFASIQKTLVLTISRVSDVLPNYMYAHFTSFC